MMPKTEPVSSSVNRHDSMLGWTILSGLTVRLPTRGVPGSVSLKLGREAKAPSTSQPTYPSKLIIVEGIGGSGKSTQLDLLRKWRVNQGFPVVFSEWNSSPIVKSITRRGKQQQLLSRCRSA
jgi:hypothetical protein